MTHAEEFTAAVRGIPGNHVAAALNTLTPGINWFNSPKSNMAERFEARHMRPGTEWPVDLNVLVRRAKARADRRPDWADL